MSSYQIKGKINKKFIKKWIYDCVDIQNPSGSGNIPMRFTKIQDGFFWESKVYDLAGWQDYSVKPRQVGFSTLNMAFIIAVMVNYPGFNAMWVSQDEENARRIRRKWDRIIDSVLNSKMSGITRSDVARRNDSELVLRNGSSVSFSFAGDTKSDAKSTGRGDTIHFAVFTESAYWTHARDAYEAIIPGLEHSNPSIVWDSTPNGMFGDGEFFYSRVQDALSGRLEGSVYFWSWWTEKRYASPLLPGDEEKIKNTLSPDEKFLIEEHKLSLEQIKWRRKKIADLGDIDVFKEIYPETIEEAFRAPGASVFSQRVIAKTRRLLNSGQFDAPINLEPYLREAGIFNHSFEPLIMSGPNGEIQSRFYVEPGNTARAPFTLGLDTAEGVTGGDPSAIIMVDRDGLLAGLFVGVLSPIIIADIASKIHHLYNCSISIEDQSTGPEVCNLLRYEMSPGDIQKYGCSHLMGNVTLSHLEKNNVATRPALVGLIVEAVNKSAVIFSDPVLLQQSSTFVRKDSKKIEHAAGCHDDAILAYAIALQGRRRSIMESSMREDEDFSTRELEGYEERFKFLDPTQKRKAPKGAKRVPERSGHDPSTAFGGLYDLL